MGFVIARSEATRQSQRLLHYVRNDKYEIDPCSFTDYFVVSFFLDNNSLKSYIKFAVERLLLPPVEKDGLFYSLAGFKWAFLSVG